MNGRSVLKIALLVTTIILCGLTTVSIASGQNALGGISGTVVDTNGAVIAGATVDIVNKGTGERRSVTTSEAGAYSAPNLQVGIYTIKATANGFSAATIQEVAVSIAFNTTIKLTLNPTSISEVIQVNSGDIQTQVNLGDSQLSTLLDNHEILDLPLLSRDPSNLVLLAPGTVRTNGMGGFSVNGSRERNNNFRVDGVDNNDTDIPGYGGGVATPNIDAIQEFRVITGNGNAEYGRNTGGIITVATKSGSNSFHGSGYMYYRSSDFAARDFFASETSPLQRKQFGGSIGGPIKKDKLFFFVNYEGDRSLEGFQDFRIVPSADARNGIFHHIQVGVDANNNPIFEDLNISSAGNNNVLGYSINPAITQLLKLFPLPNDSDPRDIVSKGNLEAFRFSNGVVSNFNNVATRVDYNINSKHVLTASYNHQGGPFKVQVGTFPSTNDGISNPQVGQLFSVGLISTFSPTLTNEARFGYNHIVTDADGAGDGGVSTILSDAINHAFSSNGIPSAANFGGANGAQINLTGIGVSDLQGFDSQKRAAGTITIADSVSVIREKHIYKFGAELRLVRTNSASNFFRSETLNFSLPTTFDLPLIKDNEGNQLDPFASGELSSLSNFTSFLYGLPASQFQAQFFDKNGKRVGDNLRDIRQKEFDVFFQDTFKVRNNLTLNYGLRWEYKGVPYEANGLFSNLVNQDPSGPEPAGGFTFQVVGKNSGSSTPLYNNDWHNFGPRFGFNYSPAFTSGLIAKLTGGPDKTSIRGGYGIYYDRIFGNLLIVGVSNPPFEADFNNNNFNLDVIQNIPRPATQTPSLTVPSNAETSAVIFPTSGNNPFSNSLNNPYEQKWSFGVQRELQSDLLVDVDYIGAKGTNEFRVVDAQLTSVARVNAINGTNTPIATSSFLNALNGRMNDAFFRPALILANGFSTYNSLQITVTKRLGNTRFGTGHIQGSYTLAHSIDNSTDPLVAQPGELSFPRDSSSFAGGLNAERGNSGFIARNNFSMSFTYNVPVKFASSKLDKAFGNWELSSIVLVHSGMPFSIFSSTDSAGTGRSQRADFGNGTNNMPAPSVPLDPHTQTGPSVTLFANPCPADDMSTADGGCSGPSLVPRQGNVGRNSFFGPGFREVDFSIIKRIPIREGLKLRLQADFFNLFNNVNFAQPVNTINSSNFGQSTSTVGIPRIIQFAIRVDF